MKIHIVFPTLPPKLDGVADYTAILARHLAGGAAVSVLTGTGQQAAPIGGGVEVRPCFGIEPRIAVRGLADAVAADPPDWLLIQYNPFSYGKWGLNLSLPVAVQEVRRRCRGTRVALMAHETYVPVNGLKFAVMTLWQRWQFRQLVAAADQVFLSTDAWVGGVSRRFPGKPVAHLPIGSNVPRVSIGRPEARARLGVRDDEVVIGLFGTAHPSRMPELMGRAVGELRGGRERVQPRVVYIGPDAATLVPHFGDVPVIADGALEAAEVSRRLSAVDVMLSPFVDGVSARRGSMIAGLQHGLAVVGTDGHHTDGFLRTAAGRDGGIILTPVSDPDAFCREVRALSLDPALRAGVGRRALDLHAAHFAWERTVESLMTAFGG